MVILGQARFVRTMGETARRQIRSRVVMTDNAERIQGWSWQEEVAENVDCKSTAPAALGRGRVVMGGMKAERVCSGGQRGVYFIVLVLHHFTIQALESTTFPCPRRP